MARREDTEAGWYDGDVKHLESTTERPPGEFETVFIVTLIDAREMNENDNPDLLQFPSRANPIQRDISYNEESIQKDANIVIFANSGGLVREQLDGTISNLPYAQLNLRFNPFGQFERNHLIATAIPRCDWNSILQILGNDRIAIQFIGRAGSGKSTHLLMLARQFPEFQYVYLPEGSRREIPVRENLMVDEAQRLYRKQRSRLFQHGNRIVFATHKCLARKLAKQGFRVETVSLDGTPDELWLSRSLQRKIDAATRDPSEAVPRLTQQTVLRLIDEYGNNIRGMERQLYETFYLLNSFRESMETTLFENEGSQRI